MESVREFYANCDPFDLVENSITSKIRGQTFTLSSSIIRDLYGMLKVSNLGFSFKGIGTPSKTQINDLFIGPNGLLIHKGYM
jgi:hypothetical protein